MSRFKSGVRRQMEKSYRASLASWRRLITNIVVFILMKKIVRESDSGLLHPRTVNAMCQGAQESCGCHVTHGRDNISQPNDNMQFWFRNSGQ